MHCLTVSVNLPVGFFSSHLILEAVHHVSADKTIFSAMADEHLATNEELRSKEHQRIYGVHGEGN